MILIIHQKFSTQCERKFFNDDDGGNNTKKVKKIALNVTTEAKVIFEHKKRVESA
jgi:hypothetical protein